MNYYNEIDSYAVEWLRNLIRAGHIARGVVDTRSIADVRTDDLRGFTQCHFFAGIGGWSFAARLAGWPDDRPMWTGSCPCQPFSNAGKRAGFDDARHLWPAWSRLIHQCRPAIVFGEQVASAAAWLELVRSDLEAMEYAVGCLPIEAASAGADHLRDRYWFVGDRDSAGSQRRITVRECSDQCAIGTASVAYADGQERQQWKQRFQSHDGNALRTARERERSETIDLADANQKRSRGRKAGEQWQARNYASGSSERMEWRLGADGKFRRVKPGIRLLVNGVSGRVAVCRSQGSDAHWYNRIAALKGFGNAIDPRPASQFIGAYMDCAP